MLPLLAKTLINWRGFYHIIELKSRKTSELFCSFSRKPGEDKNTIYLSVGLKTGFCSYIFLYYMHNLYLIFLCPFATLLFF